MAQSPAGGRKQALSLLLMCAAGIASPAQVETPAQQAPSPPGVVQPVEAPEEELEEVVVSAAKRVRSPKAMLAWLGRLVGEHSYEGHVELGSAGFVHGRQPASGAGKCIALGKNAVLCEIHLRWLVVKEDDTNSLSDAVPLLPPAVIVYAYDPAIQNIRSLLVDSQGLANGGRGELRGDTLITTTACVDMPDGCVRTSRVSARPDGKATRLEIEIVRNFDRVAHYVFESLKVAEAPAIPRESSTVSSGVPGSRSGEQLNMEAWLRRMVGRFYQFEYITIGGTLRNNNIRGRMRDGSIRTDYGDCVSIGSGPGVLCTHYAVQERSSQAATYRLYEIVLLGMNPNASRIHMLTVTNGGLVMEAGARLLGDTASWSGPCTSVDARCQRTMKISVPSESEYMVWSNGSRIGPPRGAGTKRGAQYDVGRERVLSATIYLYRISPEEGNGPDGLPRIMAAPAQDVENDRIARPSRPR